MIFVGRDRRAKASSARVSAVSFRAMPMWTRYSCHLQTYAINQSVGPEKLNIYNIPSSYFVTKKQCIVHFTKCSSEYRAS